MAPRPIWSTGSLALPSFFSSLASPHKSFARCTQFGEVFLLLLSGFVMVALRLLAPFMVAVGTDKKLAERITYPFVWGTIVFTLIFPVVRDVIIYISYTVGAFGLMLYKGQAIYTIDETTAELVKNNYYDPKFIISITLVTMTVSG